MELDEREVRESRQRHLSDPPTRVTPQRFRRSSGRLPSRRGIHRNTFSSSVSGISDGLGPFPYADAAIGRCVPRNSASDGSSTCPLLERGPAQTLGELVGVIPHLQHFDRHGVATETISLALVQVSSPLSKASRIVGSFSRRVAMKTRYCALRGLILTSCARRRRAGEGDDSCLTHRRHSRPAPE